ncbi:ribonuclease III [Petrotoga sp. 9PWA.NaAc.5.4]|uniref:ribonuclease III n=1 Tax=Petrotoga sp. 9PWA.NaAc.5.4 TaxID=1434328 RepID=UPI000EFBC74B|nr:ribonuclease III [Petrotoga sp. 9PWA.NaAc.5.4]
MSKVKYSKMTSEEEENVLRAKRVLNLPECVKNNLLFVALCHKSYVFEVSNEIRELESNERLEFLGDSVLELIISEFLYNNYGLSEGDMSKVRSIVGSETILSKLALNIGLNNFLFLGKGEDKQGGREKNSILSDAFEALLACIYLSCNYEKVKTFTLKHLKEYIEEAVEGNLFLDYKTKLQEITQEKTKKLPEYVLLNVSGPSHLRKYKVAVKLDDQILGIGEGFSKKLAEQFAAKMACEKLLQEDLAENGNK